MGAFEQIARIGKALAHPARVQIVATLLRRRTCIGCDIVEEIGLAASTTSEHLRILKAAGLVIGRIEPLRVCYSLDPSGRAPLRFPENNRGRVAACPSEVNACQYSDAI